MLLDILIIALVAFVVITRFTKFKLPKDPRDKAARKADLERLRRPLLRDDEPAAPQQPIDITPLAEARVTPMKAKAPKLTPRDVKHLDGLEQIKALEPSFSEKTFLEGAKSAYLYFVQVWNAKDEQGIENLTAPALTARLLTELEATSYAPIGAITLTSTVIDSARVHGKTAVLDVLFEGEEAGTPFRRRWTLARPLNSEDPNWDVQDMQSIATH